MTIFLTIKTKEKTHDSNTLYVIRVEMLKWQEDAGLRS